MPESAFDRRRNSKGAWHWCVRVTTVSILCGIGMTLITWVVLIFMPMNAITPPGSLSDVQKSTDELIAHLQIAGDSQITLWILTGKTNQLDAESATQFIDWYAEVRTVSANSERYTNEIVRRRAPLFELLLLLRLIDHQETANDAGVMKCRERILDLLKFLDPDYSSDVAAALDVYRGNVITRMNGDRDNEKHELVAVGQVLELNGELPADVAHLLIDEFFLNGVHVETILAEYAQSRLFPEESKAWSSFYEKLRSLYDAP